MLTTNAKLDNKGEFDKAASMCPSILKGDAKLWEKWVFIFAEIKKLKVRQPH